VLGTIALRQWLYADHHGERLMLARTSLPAAPPSGTCAVISYRLTHLDKSCCFP
jgi:hypothetical protein